MLVARLPRRAWQRLSAGRGATGHRFYDWAWISITGTGDDAEVMGCRWLVVRRPRSTGELADYRCDTTTPAPLAALVRVAGRRWTVEENFQTGKGCTGLGQHQVRTWTSWYRWTTLVMLGHLLLVAATIIARAAPCPEGLIGLSLNETRRHLIRAILPSQLPAADADVWSAWRRQPNTEPTSPLPATS